MPRTWRGTPTSTTRAATGATPRLRRGCGPWAAAASFPLRVYEPTRVRDAPDAARVARTERRFPGTLVWNECAPGELLSDFAAEDGASHRYAVVNLGGASHCELGARLMEVRDALGYRMGPVASGR